jgi:hypothetical protein
LSYAADIANKYGISLERIREILKERNSSGEDNK